MSLLDILGYAGNLLDLPGSSVRDLLSGNNPFDQWATPFSGDRRASGRDVLTSWGLTAPNEETGMSGWLQNPIEGVRDLAGFGFEMATDPTNLIPAGWFGKALKGRKAARTANAAADGLQTTRYGFVNPKVAAREMAPENPMRLLGYTPPEDTLTLYHGGHDWSASATPDKPYGMFDMSRLRTGEGGQAYGPGMYASSSKKVANTYASDLKERLTRTPLPEEVRYVASAIETAYRNGDLADDLFDEDKLSSVMENIPYYAGESTFSFLKELQDTNWLDYGLDTEDLIPHLLDELKNFDKAKFFEDPRPGSMLEKMVSATRDLKKSYVPPKTNVYQLDIPSPSLKDRLIQWEAPLESQTGNVREAAIAQGLVDDAGVQFYGLTGRELLDSYYDEPSLGYHTGAIPDLVDDKLAGMSNPARIDKSARNFAIWDQNVIDQMRVRGINGERVPINPILGPKATVEVLPVQAGSQSLQSTMTNPITRQPLPSLVPPAVAGVVYNALARNNPRGGMQ